MKQLIEKYRTNSLSHDDIERARQLLGTLSDDDLAAYMNDDWEGFECNDAPSPADKASRLAVWGRITGHVAARRPWRVAARIAAVALIAILATTTLWLHNTNRDLKAIEIATTTGSNERTTLQLPDGSTVSLNSHSNITYRVDGFTGRERLVNFDGEGYFDIAGLNGKPFIIDTPGLRVLVKGTSFNLSARAADSISTLFLVEGAVDLTSLADGNTVTLKPNEKAIYDHNTGGISISTVNPNDNITAWKDRRLTFTNATLPEVVHHLESNYAINITYDDSLTTERFTGVIPLDDLDNAIDIVESIYKGIEKKKKR